MAAGGKGPLSRRNLLGYKFDPLRHLDVRLSLLQAIGPIGSVSDPGSTGSEVYGGVRTHFDKVWTD